MAVYNFDRLNIGDGVSVTLSGKILLKLMFQEMLQFFLHWTQMERLVLALQVFERVNLVADLEVTNGTVTVGEQVQVLSI